MLDHQFRRLVQAHLIALPVLEQCFLQESTMLDHQLLVQVHQWQLTELPLEIVLQLVRAQWFEQIVVVEPESVLRQVLSPAELQWAVGLPLVLVQFAQTAVVVPGLEQLDLKMKFLFRDFCIYIRLSLHPHLQIDQWLDFD